MRAAGVAAGTAGGARGASCLACTVLPPTPMGAPNRSPKWSSQAPGLFSLRAGQAGGTCVGVAPPAASPSMTTPGWPGRLAECKRGQA